MDTTEEYIRMCDGSKEIQKDMHRFFRHVLFCKCPRIYDADGICWFNRDNKKTIWLPRQDQLQKLTGIVAIPTLLSQFNEFVFGHVGYTTQEMCNFINSCEQLWLAFVMKKVYEKFWNGKEWVKR